MLKHATPRSSPSLSSSSSTRSPIPEKLSKAVISKNITDDVPSSPDPSSCKSVTSSSGYSERSIDCDGIKSIRPPVKRPIQPTIGLGALFTGKLLSFSNYGSGIGPVITHGRAFVRKGLSFTLKKDDAYETTPKPVIKELTKATQRDSQNMKLSRNELESEDSSKPSSPVPSSKDVAPSLKSFLRLPGVYGHIPVPEGAPEESPHIVSPDSLSLNSGSSFISSNSGRISTRSWTSNTSSLSGSTNDSSVSHCSSTSEPSPTTLKVYAKCLRSDIEYKTVSLGPKVTCRELIDLLLSKARMKHRDPNLFYLTMEVTVRRWSGHPVRALLVLEENARPAQLALCRPPGNLRFALQMKKGGVVKVNDTVLTPSSQYKSLLVSYKTTSEEVVQLLLNCCGRRESKHFYALHEVCRTPSYIDRRMDPDEKPLEAKKEWPNDRRAEYEFVLRRNMSQAFSLRKLAYRTSESIRESQQTHRIQNETKPPLIEHPTTQIPHESIIDCTSTTPIVKPIMPPELPPKHSINLLPITKVDAILRSLNIQSEPNNNVSKQIDAKSVTFADTTNTKVVEYTDSSTNTEPPRIRKSPKVAEETQTTISVGPNTPSKSILKKTESVPRPIKVQSGQKVSSNGVQTELTCLTIKGSRRMPPRWNSVETLMEEIPLWELKEPKLKIHKGVTNHHSGNCDRQCNSCFYI